MSSSNIAAVVLAAGEGKRMKSDRAKVLHAVGGKAMLDHVLDSLDGAGVGRSIVVTGFREDEVRAHLGDRCVCVSQAEQRGTAHAVMQAEGELSSFAGAVVVACGDAPFLRSESIQGALELMNKRGAAGVVLTTILKDPTGYGRVIRTAGGEVEKIVEHRDASDAERAIGEINSGTYCFGGPLLFKALKEIQTDNDQGEFYLTDIVEILIRQGHAFGAFVMDDPTEAMGINSKEELATAQRVYAERAAPK